MKKKSKSLVGLSVLSIALFWASGIWRPMYSICGPADPAQPGHGRGNLHQKTERPGARRRHHVQHIGSSLQIAMSGYALGVVIGTPLGILMAWYKKVDLFARPLFDLIRPCRAWPGFR